MLDFGLKGKHVLVTGGTRGIGRAIVRALVAQSAAVTTCYTQEGEAVRSLIDELPGADLRLVRADIRNADDTQKLVSEAQETFGKLDGLVNNAGVISHFPLAEMPPEEWSRIIDTNVSGMYNTVRAALGYFATPGSIVNVTSGVGRAGMPYAAHYVTSKAAIMGFTRAMCKELGPTGIRVNAIASGVVDNTGQKNPRGEEGKAMYIAMTSLRRLGEPDDIADVALFLLSDAARYMTGAIVEVDGGI
jgi:3-oxoacyl-[acyl-carrier protein] reductase